MIYSNENKGFTIRDILIQLLIIILFVFMLVWLFPTKANFNGLNKKVDILTSTIYGTNIQTMKEAAVSYYTNQRLPQAINDVERLTLKDMLNLHLLVDFVDGNGNSCSKTDSYVEVIKLQDEYQMKINLSCTDNDAYIIVHLGCYDYCNGLGLCAKKEEITVTPNVEISCSYEYEKVLNGKWGDYGVWSGWSTTKVTEADYRQVESKSEVVLIGKKQVQTKTQTESIDARKTETKYCTEGYTLSSSKDSCVAKKTNTIDAKCPDGYSLSSNGTCSGKVEVSVNPKCPDGYDRNGAKCTKTTTSTTTAMPYCGDKSYELIEGKCYGPATAVTYAKGTYIGTYTGSSVPATNSTYYYESVSSDYVYSCETDCAFRWVYTYKKYNTVTTGGTRDVVGSICPEGYSLSGSICVKPITKTDTVTATCSKGTLSGKKCVYYENKSTKATCPAGYIASGNKCYVDSTITKEVSVSVSYSCDSGYTLNGAKCIKTVPVYEEQNVYENVTYYRYRTRTYISGNKVTKWSYSQNEASLLAEGYSLTGNKKCSK